MSNCHKCKYEITAECVPRSQKMGFPKCYQSVLTNYERLISKTPEELADFLAEIRNALTCVLSTEEGCLRPDTPCSECWLDWLRAPADEEEKIL